MAWPVPPSALPSISSLGPDTSKTVTGACGAGRPSGDLVDGGPSLQKWSGRRRRVTLSPSAKTLHATQLVSAPCVLGAHETGVVAEWLVRVE